MSPSVFKIRLRGGKEAIRLGLGLALALPLHAQLFENLGSQKVGTTVFAFLKVDVGVRSAGLGGAYVALGQDAPGMYWNPASMAFVEGIQGGISVTDYWEELTLSFAGVSFPISPYARLGLMLEALTGPAFQATDEYHPDGTGEGVTYGDYMVGISWTRKLSSRYAVAVNVKLLQEVLDQDRLTGVALDLASYYWVGFRDIRIGMGIFNIGPDAGVRGGGRYPLPVTFRAGVAGRLGEHLLSTFQVEKAVDNTEVFRIGLEWTLHPSLILRGGLPLNSRPVGEGWTGWATGFSLMLSSLRLDYAFQDGGILGGLHRVGLEIAPGGSL